MRHTVPAYITNRRLHHVVHLYILLKPEIYGNHQLQAHPATVANHTVFCFDITIQLSQEGFTESGGEFERRDICMEVDTICNVLITKALRYRKNIDFFIAGYANIENLTSNV